MNNKTIRPKMLAFPGASEENRGRVGSAKSEKLRQWVFECAPRPEGLKLNECGSYDCSMRFSRRARTQHAFHVIFDLSWGRVSCWAGLGWGGGGMGLVGRVAVG